MGITLFVALLMFSLAFGLGVAVGRRRGFIVGIAMGVGVLVLAGIGLVLVLAMSLPM